MEKRLKKRSDKRLWYDVIDAHRFSNNNLPDLKEAGMCGCFFCMNLFKPSEITEYIIEDNDSDRLGTAKCPHCGIDSVISNQTKYPLSLELLRRMNRYWFGGNSVSEFQTPLGPIKISFDGVYRRFYVQKPETPNNLDGSEHYLISFDYYRDRKPHRLTIAFAGTPAEAVIDAEKTYAFAFDSNSKGRRLAVNIQPTTPSQTYFFEVSWDKDDKSGVQICKPMNQDEINRIMSLSTGCHIRYIDIDSNEHFCVVDSYESRFYDSDGEITGSYIFLEHGDWFIMVFESQISYIEILEEG